MDRTSLYIKNKYDPIVIIVYGSYATGSNSLASDFDALVISKSHKEYHDTSLVNGVQLDVFVYPESYFDKEYDLEEFIPISDGVIVLDTENRGLKLKDEVIFYLENNPLKTESEIEDSILWCHKMFRRAERKDAEGAFRFHWLLVDSLQIFCDIMRKPYLGPKKTLLWMKEENLPAFNLYQRALADFTIESLDNWISFLTEISGFKVRESKE